MSALPTFIEHSQSRRTRAVAIPIGQQVSVARGLLSLSPEAISTLENAPSWYTDRAPAVREAMTRLLLSLEALGAHQRERILTHTGLDRAHFIIAWEEAHALGWLGVAGHDGKIAIWALMEAGMKEAANIGACLDARMRKRQPA